MKNQLSLLVLGFSVISVLPLASNAADPQEPVTTAEASESTQDRMAKLIALGPGVHNIKKDAEGRIISCLVVGQSRVSTALGKAKGLEVAREKANLSCSAEFAKWLKEEVSFLESTEDETIIMLTGEEGGEDETIRESGKSIEKTSKKIESISKGLLRGLQLLHKDVDSAGKTYSVVKGWKLDTAEAAKGVSKALKDDDESTAVGSSPKTREKSSPNSNPDKEIPNEVVTSDDADEFFSGSK